MDYYYYLLFIAVTAVMDELERTKLEVQSLKQELSALRQAYEVTLLELAEAREG